MRFPEGAMRVRPGWILGMGIFLIHSAMANESIMSCESPGATFPLDEEQFEFFEGARGPKNPSDHQIITPADIQYCANLKGRTPTATIDPHSLPDDGSVWRVGSNRWNEDHEKGFAKWVEAEVGKDFFSKFKIATDCADAAFSLRMIYARIHHLPMRLDTGGATNYTQSSKKYAGLTTVKNWSVTNWKTSLLQDQRFRRFLDDAKIGMGTVNLTASTYPIKIESNTRPGKLNECVRPGTVLLDGGHTRFISKIDTLERIAPILEMSSTVPAAVRDLYQSEPSLYYAPNDRGVLSFNWAVNCNGFVLVKDEQMPNYSREQYSLFQDRSAGEVLKQMTPGTRGGVDRAYVDRKFAEIKTLLNRRLELVLEAEKKLRTNPNYFRENPAEYENFSTPSLDAKIRGLKDRLWSDIEKNSEPGVSDYFKLRCDRFIIVLGNKRFVSFSDYLELTQSQPGGIYSDPSATVEQRWGWDQTSLLVERAKVELKEAEQRKKDQYAALDWWDTLRYKAGQLELSAEKEIRLAKDHLKLLKSRGVKVD